jgi:hypothetical protein
MANRSYQKKRRLTKELDTLREKLFGIHEKSKERDPEKLDELTSEWNNAKERYLQKELELRKCK